jgi:hypothetical protein
MMPAATIAFFNGLFEQPKSTSALPAGRCFANGESSLTLVPPPTVYSAPFGTAAYVFFANELAARYP